MIPVGDQTRPSTAEALIGTWRRFGETGPVYQVIGTAPTILKKEFARIRVIETNEELDYSLAHLLDDPDAG